MCTGSCFIWQLPAAAAVHVGNQLSTVHSCDKRADRNWQLVVPDKVITMYCVNQKHN